jgi:signal transduction histidine kinase
MFTAPPFEPAERAHRIVTLQRNIILPARLVILAVVFFMVYEFPVAAVGTPKHVLSTAVNYGDVFETILNVFIVYGFLVLTAMVLVSVVRRFPPGSVQWLAFVLGLGDGVFLAGLTILTRGFDSPLYWVYPAIIVLNAISIPLATLQIVLNLLLTILYLGAGLLESETHPELTLLPFPIHNPRTAGAQKIVASDLKDLPRVAAWLKDSPEPLVKYFWESLPAAMRDKLCAPIKPGPDEEEVKKELAKALSGMLFPSPRIVMATTGNSASEDTQADPYVLKVAVLLLLTFCCYAVQVLVAGQERAKEEQEEFIVRTGQLRAAGRLAAEFAHQIKNPLAIVNNVIYTLQKSLKGQQPEITQQIAIIKEEVAKADLIITQIMGYAQLSEGRVEKLSAVEELEKAIQQVFPPGVTSNIKIHRNYAGSFPPLLMQRRHFAEAVSNLLQNARDILAKGGNIYIEARCSSDYSVEVMVRDDGPGIAPDKLGRIFEAYYTTKERGSGLGLAIVKHNVELYGGSVSVESELGKGAKFTLLFPAKSLIKFGK